MLKELYNKSIDKHSPDIELLESTKNAMYSAILASDSITDKACADIENGAGITLKKVFNHKRLAACCAAFALVVSVSAVCTVVFKHDAKKPEQDPFASSDNLAFEGNSPNDGKEPSQYISSETSFDMPQMTSRTDSTNTLAVTTVPDTASEPLQTQPAQTSAPAAQQTDTTSLLQVQIATTTTANVQIEPTKPFDGDFGYYDPQYDPAFKDEFNPNMGEEFLFEYDNIYYYFDCFKSDRVMLEIDGQNNSLRKAIDENLIEPYELLEFDGFICKGYYNDEHGEKPIDIHPNGEEHLRESGGFMNYENDCEIHSEREWEDYRQGDTEPIR